MFSLHSIIAAIIMVDQIAIMIAAVSLAYDRDIRRLGTACSLHGRTSDSYMLALAFCCRSVRCCPEGFDAHIPRDDIYFAMALARVIEAFNVLAAAIAALRPFAGGAIQTDAAYVGDSNIDRGLADGDGDTQRRGVFGNS